MWPTWLGAWRAILYCIEIGFFTVMWSHLTKWFMSIRDYGSTFRRHRLILVLRDSVCLPALLHDIIDMYIHGITSKCILDSMPCPVLVRLRRRRASKGRAADGRSSIGGVSVVSAAAAVGTCAKGGRPKRKRRSRWRNRSTASVSNALVLKECYFDGVFLIFWAFWRMISQQQETCHEDGGSVSWYENGRYQNE